MSEAPLRIGVSACLLGQNVRFDGGHKRDSFIQLLGKMVELVPVCPEVELGLGIPREPIRLVHRLRAVHAGFQVRLIAPKSGRDLTEEMNMFAARRSEEIARLSLDGFVVKKDSPSCGMERVRLYEEESGMPKRAGRGLFTAALMARCPRLPVEEEGRLRDPVLRDNFLVRIYVQNKVKRLFSRALHVGELVALHASMKLLLLAHSPSIYRELGRVVASGGSQGVDRVTGLYADKLADALRVVPAIGQHVNVLEHMAGYLKRCASRSERAELGALIEDYRLGLSPRAVPLTLLRHFIHRYEISYLKRQVYLNPYPRALAVGGEP
jgi:uncharacterized protein YbbK (DUF523 family)/uncharacterized protein YbgA (DUF1722 family)